MIPSGQFIRGLQADLLPVHRFALGRTSRARGGSSLNAPEFGINVQDWDGLIEDEQFFISAANHAQSLVVATPNAQSATFAFDRNMELVVCWNTPTGSVLYWFDDSEAAQQTTVFTGFSRAMVIHDDVRNSSSAISDVLMVYQRSGSLYYRQQRDRYATEYLISNQDDGELKSCGMGRSNRLIFELG